MSKSPSKKDEHPIMQHYNSKVPWIFQWKLLELFLHVRQMIAFMGSLPENHSFTDIMKALEVKRGFRLKTIYSEKIPKEGPLVIVANHPHILVDQLSIGAMIEPLRPHSEIRIITDNAPKWLENIYPFSEKVWKTPKEKAIFRKRINTLLKNNGTLIVFPGATLTYRHWLNGYTREYRWRSGAIHFAKYANAPIIPIHVTAKTSMIYNFCSNFFSREIMQNLNFRQALKKEMYIGLTVWDPIHPTAEISPEYLRDIVYWLGDEGYALKKTKKEA